MRPEIRQAAHSLRRRLLLWLLASTAVIGAAALVDTYGEAIQTADVVSDRVLAGSALAIAERIVVAEDGSLQVDIPYVALEMLTSAAQDRVFYRVNGPQGEFLTGYQSLPSIGRSPGEAALFADAVFRGEAIRVATLQRSASTGVNSVPFTVTVAETTLARRQLTEAILWRSALRLLAMIGGAALIVWVAVTYSLRPLYRLSEAIAERSPGDLHPIDQAVPQEVEGLVETVNSFMVRLQSALEALRNFTGNASHQLRTPLAVIRTQLALSARAGTLEEAQAAALKGDHAVAHAERIIAQLLLLANIEAAGSRQAMAVPTLDLTSLAQEMTADHVPKAAGAGIDLGFEGSEGAGIAADPLLTGEMLHNLIDNAIAYAGRGSVVTVRVVQHGSVVRLEVEDDGPGIAAADLTSVRKRFSRGAHGQGSGAGLGLPIIDEIARLYDARLDLESGIGGRGLRAIVTFPQVDAPPSAETGS